MSRNHFWLAGLCCLAVLPARGSGLDSRSHESPFRVRLPGDVSAEDVVLADERLKARLIRHAVEELDRRHPDAAGRPDAVVVFVTAEGEPILPDLQAERNAGSVALGGGNTLTFTFDSPDHPWTAGEIATLTTDLAAFQPVAKTVYGDPAFANTVNIRKDPSLGGTAFYAPTINEIALTDASAPNTTCHEMLHAFRDDYVIELSIFEEGMTRAAEIEVFNMLPGYLHPDENHSQPFDVYYEGLDRHVVGSEAGNLFLGWPTNVFLRYQLTGYAWAKALIQNADFFVDFNTELYSRALLDPDVLTTESALVDILAQVQPEVEGRPVAEWYASRGVLDTTPPQGFLLYHRIYEFGVDHVLRDTDGTEIPQGGALVQWSVHDYQGTMLDGGAATTNGFGGFTFTPTIPGGYTGRLAVVAEVGTPLGTIREVALRPAAADSGIFGVVEGSESGTVTITPLDPPGGPLQLPVVRGVFSKPSLAALRGSMLAEFTDPSQQVTLTRQFNKDASDYFLLFSRPAGRTPDSDDVPGLPLTVDDAGGGSVTLSWGASCLAPDADYAVYEGLIGDFASHTPRLCSTAGLTSVTLAPAAGSTYYLIAPRSGANEGSQGVDGAGAPRPQGERTCLNRSIDPCP